MANATQPLPPVSPGYLRFDSWQNNSSVGFPGSDGIAFSDSVFDDPIEAKAEIEKRKRLFPNLLHSVRFVSWSFLETKFIVKSASEYEFRRSVRENLFGEKAYGRRSTYQPLYY